MSRPPIVSDEHILDRARQVFLERGYSARTRQIASAVGLTWGAIALRFGDKRSLFQRAMAGPQRTPFNDRPKDGLELHGLLAGVRARLWERWPLRLQYRLAIMPAARDDELDGMVRGLVADFDSHLRDGTLRSDLNVDVLARLAVTLLTGDVAQRFIARERSLPADPSLIDGIARLLSAPHCQHE